jgi:GAF domain-containing protein
MAKNPSTQQANTGFITTDRMVVNILIVTAIGLVVIAIAVGLVGDNPLAAWILFIAALVNIVGVILASRGITLPGRVMIPVILTIVVGFIAYTRDGLNHISVSAFPVIVVLAGLLLGTRGSFIFAAIASVAAIIIGYAHVSGLSPFAVPGRTGYDDIAIAITLFFITASVLNIIIRRLTESIQEAQEYGEVQQTANLELRKLQGELEQRVSERTSELERRATQLQTITGLSESIAELQDLNELFPAVTRLISERFGFYHVGIFFVDGAREFAVLQAANSEGGKRMLERGHRLQLGTGVVGYSALTGQPRIALDVGADAVFFDNPDLPNTRSETALPLKSRGETIGVLDVQSTEPGAFSTEDLEVLTALANQVSIAFENVRLLTETRAALTQVQEVYNEFTRTEWSRAVSLAEQPGFRYNAGRIELLENELRTPEVASAVESGRVVANQADGSREKRGAVAVPVKLRGEVIGILHIQSNDPDRQWLDDEVSLVEAVAERAAFAMENARLFQDARRRATKEQLISEASARIGGALNLENILMTTAEELERVLGGSEVLIQFQNKEAKE